MEAERRIGVAVDFSPCSHKALKWAIDNALRDGDNLILVTIQPVQNESGETQLWETTGSPLIPFKDFSDQAVLKKYGLKPVDDETLKILQRITNKNNVVVLMKIYWGDPAVKICYAIDNIPLSWVIMGHRGLGVLKRTLMGSVSNHVVNHGTCPVTVVKDSH